MFLMRALAGSSSTWGLSGSRQAELSLTAVEWHSFVPQHSQLCFGFLTLKGAVGDF